MNESSDLADEYIALNGTASPDNYTDYNTWYSSLRQVMLQRLNSRMNQGLTIEIMDKVDADLNVTNTVDPECKNIWFPLGIRMGYSDVLAPARTFVSTQGRMKYLSPIYSALIASGQLDTAKEWFQENIDFYHPYAVAKLHKMLYGDKDVPESLVKFEGVKFLQ